jgi:ParB/RepB/Spo0J family partition protein
MGTVLSDEGFNCRGHIPPSDVVDLARDITENGLQNPILVQPWAEVRGKDYRIVSGHRRFAAYLLNKAETIPCIVKTGLTETQALILNLGENTNRKQLNIVQEAKALERLRNAGLGQTDIAGALKVPRPWVQTRMYVLDFPPDIQDEIAAGVIVQAQIHQIHSLPEAEWYDAVRHIKDARIKANGKKIRVKVPKKPKPEDIIKATPRDTDQIEAMLDHMMEQGEVGLHTRCLAWAAGNISTLELLQDFQQYADVELGKTYRIPVEGIAGVA